MHRKTITVAASSMVSLLLMSGLHPATAADAAAPAEPVVTFDTISAAELAVAASGTTETAKEAERDFILDQAAQGILLDAADVEAAAIDEGTYAWSNNVEPRRVEVAQVVEDGYPIGSEIGVITDHAEQLDPEAFAVMGSNELTELEGVAASWGGCVAATNAGDRLSSCWSLYRARETNYNPDRNYYYYGRYVVATGEVRDGVDEYPMKIDIRSRPTEGTSDRVLTARGYYPFPSDSNCSSTSVGVQIAAFGATLPISNCDNTTVTPDGKAIKVEFSAGTCHDSRSEGLDLGITFAADASKPRPAYSDYNYARFSSNRTGPCDWRPEDDVRVIFADPGW